MFRAFGFKLIDFLKGSRVTNHLWKIVLLNEHAVDYDSWLKNKLDALLLHATKETTFYSRLDLGRDFSSYPIMNKMDFKEQASDFEAKNYLNQKRYPMSTSGSTGTPFTIYQDATKRQRVTAEVIYYANQAGYTIGEKLLYVRAWPAKTRKTGLKRWKENILPVEATLLDDTSLQRTLDLLRDQPVKAMLAYGSYLDMLSKYIERTNYPSTTGRLKSIVSYGEGLNVHAREMLEDAIGVRVYSRYSNQENGMIAQDQGTHTPYQINRASYHVEFLKPESNEPASPGEDARIVITDLFNYATPIIRYDTGDIGRYALDENHRIVLETIQGRSIDMIYDTQGRPISSIVVGRNLRDRWPDFDRCRQYQLIQETDRGYSFLLNFEDKTVDELIIKILHELLGEDAIIQIHHVETIPNLSSGKYKYVVNRRMSHQP